MGMRLGSVKVVEPVITGIACSSLGRYREFDITLRNVQTPPGSTISWSIGLDIAHNYNNLCKSLLEHKEYKWLWILGDDHVLRPDILMNLIKRDVDIVAPLCLQRAQPFAPVIYKSEGGKHYQADFGFLKGKKGLIEVDACGNAGMLIRREVIEAIGGDWHRVGWIQPDRGSSDLYFCKRAKEKGYKIHVDLDNTIGHIAHMSVWPVRDFNNEYSLAIREALYLGK